MTIKAAIIGVSGYTGGELIRILAEHPETELVGAYGRRTVGKKVEEIHPNLEDLVEMTIKKPDYSEIGNNTDVTFTAVPHGVAMKHVPQLLEAGSKVVDLSADYRLDDVEIYEKYYTSHENPEIESVYGLPEIYREKIRKADLVANPGCYPTAAILSLAPLLTENKIRPSPIIIDAHSGTSGAGTDPSPRLHHPVCAENVIAYNATTHRHEPEISQEIQKLASEETDVYFTPHLIPVVRGILSTSHVFTDASDFDREKALNLYQEFYEKETFVRISEELPQVNSTMGSNFCDIGLELRADRIVVVSAIDNLVKGASGQAVQNMNLMFDLEESEGLKSGGIRP